MDLSVKKWLFVTLLATVLFIGAGNFTSFLPNGFHREDLVLPESLSIQSVKYEDEAVIGELFDAIERGFMRVYKTDFRGDNEKQYGVKVIKIYTDFSDEDVNYAKSNSVESGRIYDMLVSNKDQITIRYHIGDQYDKAQNGRMAVIKAEGIYDMIYKMTKE